jgi:nucleotide-binding universal stress UspA family protein
VLQVHAHPRSKTAASATPARAVHRGAPENRAMLSELTARTVVLAAVDQTNASHEVIQTAVALSRAALGAELHFVHVVNPNPSRQVLARPVPDLVARGSAYVDEIVAEAGELTTVRVAGHLGIGGPVARILQVAYDLGADLLVVGTHGKSGLKWLLGSVSRKLLRLAPCAVLLARAKHEEPLHPELDPPCRSCIDVQFATGGEQLWCGQHSARHVHGRLHYAGTRDGYGTGSMFLRSDDV